MKKAFLASLATLGLALALAPAMADAGDPEIGISGIQPALERLVVRENVDAFLIIQEATTGKFVQFSHHPENGLVLDLPVDNLSEDEIQRASALLVSQGAEFLSWQVDDARMQAFNLFLRHDVETAGDLARAVMQDVYGFDDGAVYTLVEN